MSNKKHEITSKTAYELSHGCFQHLEIKDGRLRRRATMISTRICQQPETKFSKLFPTVAEKEGAYRFVENSKIEPSTLFASVAAASFISLEKERPDRIIIASDTTTYSKNRKIEVDGMGPVGTLTSNGFFMHTALWIDIEGVPRGVLHTSISVRAREKVAKDRWKYTKIEDKESYKWLKPIKVIEEKIPESISKVYVSDRESDIHEYFELLIANNCDYVIRHARSRRTLENSEYSKVKEELDREIVKAIVKTELPCKTNNKITKQDITLKLTWKKVRIQPREGGLKIHKKRNPFFTNCIRAQGTFNNGKQIRWLLYTSLPVTTLKEALEILRIYKSRWRIEEYHLALKSGLGIEKARFKSANNIMRFVALCVPMAVKLLEIRYCNTYKPKENVKFLLRPIYIKALKMLFKTQKKKIPKIITVRMLVETVAIAGGWMARKRDGPPGIRTLWSGWRKLETFVEAIKLME